MYYYKSKALYANDQQKRYVMRPKTRHGIHPDHHNSHPIEFIVSDYITTQVRVVNICRV